MPFAYYGAKRRHASKYPPPIHRTVVEPFAGSAAYSMHHIENLDRVILIEKDPGVVDIWERLKKMTDAELDALDHLLDDERSTEPLIVGLGGGTQMKAALEGRSRKITEWMKIKWPQKKKIIRAALPYLDRVEVRCGDYSSAPLLDATYFVDPPYESDGLKDRAGIAYRYGSADIDYLDLGMWCRSLPGQVIVCEQEPASWLPFETLTVNRNIRVDTRTEVVWTSPV